jgi:hypothetical protein
MHQSNLSHQPVDKKVYRDPGPKKRNVVVAFAYVLQPVEKKVDSDPCTNVVHVFSETRGIFY